jgi:hypothetical protein
MRQGAQFRRSMLKEGQAMAEEKGVGSSSKKLSEKVAVETMSVSEAKRLVGKTGFSRVVIVRRDEKQLEKIKSITIHES